MILTLIANGSTVATIDDLVAYLNADTTTTPDNMEIIVARDAAKSKLITVTYTNQLLVLSGVTSSVGVITFQMGTDAGTGAAKYIATGTIPASSNG